LCSSEGAVLCPRGAMLVWGFGVGLVGVWRFGVGLCGNRVGSERLWDVVLSGGRDMVEEKLNHSK
jgi:hypothetical protein